MARAKKYVPVAARQARRKRRVRIFLMLVCLTMAFLVVRAVVMKAARPYVISYSESHERSDIQQQIAQAKAENLALKRDIVHIGTPEGKEEEARKLGWVKTGEVAVVVPQVGPSPFASEPLPQESVWDRIGRKMAGVFAKGK